MKRLILTILLLLIASPAYPFGAAMMAACGSSAATATAYCATCTGTCVYCEDFEGATDCDDATADTNCRYTYTDTIGAGGTLDYTTANTTVQCSSTATNAIGLTRAGANVSTLYDFGSSYTEVYISGFIKVATRPVLSAGTGQPGVEFLNASGASHVKIQLYNDGGTYKFRFNHFNQAVGAVYTLGPAFTDGAWYRFRIYWKANQASAGVDFYMDATQYTPADTSTYNSNIRKIQYDAVLNTDGSMNYDNVRIQSDAYPACP